MPTIYVISQRKNERKLLELVFPLRTSADAPAAMRWVWPELEAKKSFIQGFGLFPRNGGAIDWHKLATPLAMPYLGMETEVESSVQARVLRSVLCGSFDLLRREQLYTPEGHVWVQDGLYITCMSQSDLDELADKPPLVDNPDEELLQVPVEPEMSAAVSYIDQGDEQVVYLLKEETRSLLHLPHHIFNLLAAHADDEHADRNMSTHVVQFTRAKHEHLLVSAHPIFRHSAFIMGNVNEPPKGAPSLELLELHLTVAADDDPLMRKNGFSQDGPSLAAFRVFEAEHPEVLLKSTFFVTRKQAFEERGRGELEELTVVYGSSYKRTYSTWGHAGTPLRYHLPNDKYEEGTWERWARWPMRSPGWFNVDCQPTNRVAFKRVGRSIELLPDLPAIVSARRLGLDGDERERRMAKIPSLEWNTHLHLSATETQPFSPPTSWRFAGGVAASFAGYKVSSKHEFHSAGIAPKPTSARKAPFAFPSYPSSALSEAERAAASPASPATATANEAKATPPLTGLVMPRAYELPKELQNTNRDELRRLCEAEEMQMRARRKGGDMEIEEYELSELDWLTPYMRAPGGVLWCKMKGYPFWPAEVVESVVMDAEIAHKRKERAVFVRFFGWGNNAYHWSDMNGIKDWDEGVRDGLLAVKHKKPALEKSYQKAYRQATAARHARPMQSLPPPPPPWWEVQHVGEVEMVFGGHAEEGGKEDEEDEGEEDEDEDEDEDEEEDEREAQRKRDEIKWAKMRTGASMGTRRANRVLNGDETAKTAKVQEESTPKKRATPSKEVDEVLLLAEVDSGADHSEADGCADGEADPETQAMEHQLCVEQAALSQRGRAWKADDPEGNGWSEWLKRHAEWAASRKLLTDAAEEAALAIEPPVTTPKKRVADAASPKAPVTTKPRLEGARKSSRASGEAVEFQMLASLPGAPGVPRVKGQKIRANTVAPLTWNAGKEEILKMELEGGLAAPAPAAKGKLQFPAKKPRHTE